MRQPSGHIAGTEGFGAQRSREINALRFNKGLKGFASVAYALYTLHTPYVALFLLHSHSLSLEADSLSSASY